MDFSVALQNLKAGEQVQRQGWNGKGMFIFIVPANSIAVDGRESPPFIAIKNVQGKSVPWVTSQEDVLAEDWQLVH